MARLAFHVRRRVRSDCFVDCGKGRELGCQTYCCRLLVRLEPDERAADNGNAMAHDFVEKSADGYCVHLDRGSLLCGIWDTRPRVCRGYDCNSDFLLQVAVRNQFRNIAELVRIAATAYIPRETYIRVPSDRDS